MKYPFARNRQPAATPQRTATTITVPGADADQVVERIRNMGGALLSFTPKPGGWIDLHIIIAADLVEQAATDQPR